MYAETLGAELGPYKTPERRFGQLQWQAFRAASLIVDTGRFDIRQFHRVVLDQGPVPLPALERAVEDWIAKAQASAAQA